MVLHAWVILYVSVPVRGVLQNRVNARFPVLKRIIGYRLCDAAV